jgi:ribosomal protein L9
MPAKAGSEGNQLLSVTASDIKYAVEAQTNVVIDRRKIAHEPIKTPAPTVPVKLRGRRVPRHARRRRQ